MSTLLRDLSQVLNIHSVEGDSDTPDTVLAQYLIDCLKAWNKAINHRREWSRMEDLTKTLSQIQETGSPLKKVALRPKVDVHEFRYRLQNRYQDSGWQNTKLRYAKKKKAKRKAKVMAEKGMLWGMVRVVDRVRGEVIKTYPAL